MGAGGKGKGKSRGGGKGSKGAAPAGRGKGADDPKWVVKKPTVLVTGASGYIAGHIIKTLLGKRYTVQGTVRSLESAKVAPLKALFPDLSLFAADLLGGPDDFAKAAEGCTYIIHAASPVMLDGFTDGMKEVIEPALKGTEAVMKAASIAKVKRVVFTSSTVTIGPSDEFMAKTDKDTEKVFTSEDWNEDVTAESSAYMYSKVVAEKKAVEMGKELGIEVVVLNPALVFGPVLSPSLWGFSVGLVVSLLNGETATKGLPPFCYGMVDVRDVAFGHAAALEVAEAAGNRYILSSSEGMNMWDVTQMLEKGFKAYALPKEGKEPEYRPKFNTESTEKVLKVKLRPVSLAVSNMARTLIKLGVVEHKVLLKKPKWGKVKDINPESKGLNLMTKVISCKTLEQKERGQTVAEAVVGDDTGIVTLRMSSEVTVGKTVAIRNCFVTMIGESSGYIRVRPGKWGKIAEEEAEEDIEPNMDLDISATEYELVES